MKIYGDKMQWKRGENDLFIVLSVKSTLSLGGQGIQVNSKNQGGQRCEERLKVVNFIF